MSESPVDKHILIAKEDIPSLRDLRQAAQRLHKDAELYKKSFNGREGYTFESLNAAACFLDFLVNLKSTCLKEDEGNTGSTDQTAEHKRICRVCGGEGHVDHKTEIEKSKEVVDQLEPLKHKGITRKRGR